MYLYTLCTSSALLHFWLGAKLPFVLSVPVLCNDKTVKSNLCICGEYRTFPLVVGSGWVLCPFGRPSGGTHCRPAGGESHPVNSRVTPVGRIVGVSLFIVVVHSGLNGCDVDDYSPFLVADFLLKVCRS